MSIVSLNNNSHVDVNNNVDSVLIAKKLNNLIEQIEKTKEQSAKMLRIFFYARKGINQELKVINQNFNNKKRFFEFIPFKSVLEVIFPIKPFPKIIGEVIDEYSMSKNTLYLFRSNSEIEEIEEIKKYILKYAENKENLEKLIDDFNEELDNKQSLSCVIPEVGKHFILGEGGEFKNLYNAFQNTYARLNLTKDVLKKDMKTLLEVTIFNIIKLEKDIKNRFKEILPAGMSHDSIVLGEGKWYHTLKNLNS
ncbi:MAG: hypothetical protein K1000chlam3_01066 [Chlamydiae bacterium]|nr:hypothetical protein [Chlamydiota bacterium]